jgi:hypothetical protein
MNAKLLLVTLLATLSVAACSQDNAVNPAKPAPFHVPAWMTAQGPGVDKVLKVPNTATKNFDVTPLLARGYDWNTDHNGHPQRGIFTYSGCDVDRETSRVFFCGGGGAHAWRGNDVRVVNLEEDAPKWKLFSQPSMANQVPDGGGPVVTNHDGMMQACHSYHSPFWSGKTQKFYMVRTQNVWNYDGGMFNFVWRLDDPEKPVWTKVNGGNELPSKYGWDGTWRATDPDTGFSWQGSNSKLNWYDPVADKAGPGPNVENDSGAGAAAIGKGKLLFLGELGADKRTATMFVDLATQKVTYGRISGPGIAGGKADEAGSWKWGGCMGYDDANNCWVGFIDDGRVYEFHRVSDSEFKCVSKPLSGAPIPAGSNEFGNRPFGRFKYVPRLCGFVLPGHPDNDFYFIQTSPLPTEKKIEPVQP